MKDVNEIVKKAERRKVQLQSLFDKDEENYNLWMGKQEIYDDHPMSINITGMEMVEKSRKVLASLNRARLDVHVYPPDKWPNPQGFEMANQEERMYYYGFDKADERLSFIGEPSLRTSMAWQAVVLGRVAVRVMVYEDDGEVIFDYLPLNPRFLTFEFGKNGLLWACYETFRSPSCIKDEYGVDVAEDIEGKGTSVSDYWDTEHNVRFLTKSKERLGTAYKHGLKEVPLILQPVSRAPKAISIDGIDVTSWGESFYDPVKNQFKNLNRMRSIVGTHAHLLSKKPTEVIHEAGVEPDIEEEHISFHPGALIKHARSVEFKSMDIADIPASMGIVMEDLKRGIDQATYVELSPDESAHSGAALRILGQGKQDVENPFTQTVNTGITRICRMGKKQIISQGLTIPVRTVKGKQYVDFDIKPELLENDFYVDAELVRRDVYDEVEGLQRAQLMKQAGWMSDEDIMEKILLLEDVQSQKKKIRWEGLEAEIPELSLIDDIIECQSRAIDAQGNIVDQVMFDKVNMLKEKLALLEMQQQQAVMPQQGGQAPPGASQGQMGAAPTRTAAPRGA